ncbi:MAG TPA: hypothetical protein VF188_12425 [Longimicrobiales bacterium]
MNARRNRLLVEILLPILIILALFTLTLIWNVVAAFVVLFLGLVIWLARYVQRHEPHQPGE